MCSCNCSFWEIEFFIWWTELICLPCACMCKELPANCICHVFLSFLAGQKKFLALKGSLQYSQKAPHSHLPLCPVWSLSSHSVLLCKILAASHMCLDLQWILFLLISSSTVATGYKPFQVLSVLMGVGFLVLHSKFSSYNFLIISYLSHMYYMLLHLKTTAILNKEYRCWSSPLSL